MQNFGGCGGFLLTNLCVQVYCRTCNRCICAICVLEEHRTHKTVSVQTERLSKQVERTGAAGSLRRCRWSPFHCLQKHMARTEQEMLNRIREKEGRVGDVKRRLEGVQV